MFNSDYTQAGASSFSSTAGSVSFGSGASTTTVTIDPSADTTVESDETVVLTLSSSSTYNRGTTSAVTGTIANDDVALPSISIAVSPASVQEDGTNSLAYTFTRTGSSTNALTVNYTVGGTADEDDHGIIPGSSQTIAFAAGSSTVSVTLDPIDDTTVEPDETVVFNLVSGTGYTIGTPSAATGTIANDDVDLITQVGEWDPLSYAKDVVVVGNYAYAVGDWLEILDMSNPGTPVQVGSCDINDGWGVEVVGNYAYVADNESGLKIINISNPTAPVLTGSYDTSGSATGVEVVGNISLS